MKVTLTEEEANEVFLICKDMEERQNWGRTAKTLNVDMMSEEAKAAHNRISVTERLNGNKYDPWLLKSLEKTEKSLGDLKKRDYEIDGKLIPFIRGEADRTKNKYKIILSNNSSSPEYQHNYEKKLAAIIGAKNKLGYIPDVSQYQNFMASQEVLCHRRPYKRLDAVRVSLTQDDMSKILHALDSTHNDLFTDSCENHLNVFDKQRGKNLDEMDFIKGLQTKICRNLIVCKQDSLKTKLNFFSGREALTICHCLRHKNGGKDIENKISANMPDVLRKTLSTPEEKADDRPKEMRNQPKPIGY